MNNTAPPRHVNPHISSSPLMRSLLKVGAVGVLLPAMILIAVAQCLLPAAVTAPQIRSVQDVDAPVALIFATLAGIAISYTVVEPSTTVWRMGSSSRRWCAQARVLILVAAYLAVVAVGSFSQLPTTANVLLTSVGEGLIATALIGYRLAWVLPGLHAAVAGLLGAQFLGTLSWWAWPADPNPSTSQTVGATALVIAGLLLVRFHGTDGAVIQT